MAQSATHLSSTSQQYLEIADITNDLLILRDGSSAVLLEVSAINFGLLSEPEQDAIIYAYAALINSLSFPIQIAIISRPKDVTQYLEYVDEQLQHAPSDARRLQISQYRQFVANLITDQNVLEKKFYVVLPLSALELGVATSVNPVAGLFASNTKPIQFDKSSVIQRSLNTLGPRRDHMISQFARFGLKARQLSTKELIQLFYVLYNSQSAEGVRVVDSKEYTSAVIQAQGTVSMPNLATEAPTVAPAPAAPVQAAAPVAAPIAPAPAMTAAPAPVPAPAQMEQSVAAIPREGANFAAATPTSPTQPPTLQTPVQPR